VTFTQTIEQDVQALALSPDQVPPNITLQVEAIRPDGSRTPMIRLNTRADWNRRYWFERPVALPQRHTHRGRGDAEGSGSAVGRVCRADGDAAREHKGAVERAAVAECHSAH
jgi:hypothetical protein